MEGSNKKKYMAPVVLDLGEMANGTGLICETTGSSADESCNNGTIATLACDTGANAQGGCFPTGTTASGDCGGGSSVTP